MLELIPVAEDIEVYYKFAVYNSFAFEYNDFFSPALLDDKAQLEKRIEMYLSLDRDRSNDTLHGAFYDVIHFSQDSKMRNVALERMRQSVEIAQRLSCKSVIFHTNFSREFIHNKSYEDHWLECSEKAVRLLLREYSSVEIYFENMFDALPRQLAMLAEQLKDESRFGVCLDISHMMLATDEPEEWFRVLSPYIKHFHFNDTFLKTDDHLPVGDGNVEWSRIFELMRQYGLMNKSQLFEVRGIESVKRSYKYYKELLETE